MSYFIIIRGPLGCGKTTISKKLSTKLNAHYVSADEVLEKNDLLKDFEEGYISQKNFILANEIISKEVLAMLKQEVVVVIDENFYWKSQLEDLKRRLKCKGFVFSLKAPLDVCIDRDKKRENPHGEFAAREVYEKVSEFDIGEVIDVTKSLDNVLEDIERYVVL